MSKIKGADFDRIADAISPLDTEEARAQYRSGDIARAEHVKNLDKRYRWDLFNAACGWRGACDLYDAGMTDAHIDTALRAIVPPLNEENDR